jgi:hypothetical protein
MLDKLTLATFAPLVGQVLRLRLDDGAAVEVVLESATESPGTGWRPPGDGPVRTPFSLVFRGPPQFVLPQRIYRFEHDVLGEVDIFVVPIGRTAAGVAYEAIFS